MQDTDSHLIAKEPCPSCGSRDNLARYSDGHGYCFGCEHYEHGDGTAHTEPSQRKHRVEGLISGEYKPLLKRRITEETARKFGYQVGEYKGKLVQIAPYYDASGTMVAQKIRDAEKNFITAGDNITHYLFGANLWGTSGKKIVITEGEIDAMSVSQAQGNKWPVVSVPNGAKGAAKALGRQLEYLEGFEEVILMFDNDEPGREAAAECADLFSPGKCKVASLPTNMKDANDLLVAGREQEIINAIWNAKAYRPDGLVNVMDLREEILEPTEMGLPWFLDELTAHTFGRRYGEVYGFGAGTGVGKTDLFTQQIAYDREVLGLQVGTIFLEQKPKETSKRIAGKIAKKRFHIPNAGWTNEELLAAVERMGDQVTLYDSFGQTDWSVVKGKIKYMAVAQGIRLFYLDHLTAMADTADEKGSLEQIMKEMAGLAQELDIIIHFISHLATPEGKPHEEGGRVSIRHFKGSRAIGFWSFFMFGLERDQQADDPVVRQTTTLRILKDRYTGNATGEVIYLGYDRETGMLSVTTAPTEASPFKDETKHEF